MTISNQRLVTAALLFAAQLVACTSEHDPAVNSLSSAATTAGLATVSTVETATGFPYWYGDSAGVRLELCLDPADPCVAGSTVPIADQPPAVPGNFPDEGFYYDAVARITLPRKARATLTIAIESAFGNAAGTVAAGDQITFQRINLKVTGGLVPGAAYTVTHPYGVDRLVAAADGSITQKVAGGRFQLGCGGPPCDFGLALGGRVGPFLSRDPSDLSLPLTPPGFLGDGASLHRVVGSPFATNLFRIAGPNVGGPGVNSLETNQFTIAGKVAGPLLADQRSVTFGSQPVSSISSVASLRLTNVGPSALTVTSASFAGTDFAVVSNGCGEPLARDSSCVLGLVFQPTAEGSRPDRLTVAATTNPGVTRPLVVRVIGFGAPPATAPVASLSLDSLAFAATPVGQATAPAALTIANVGTAPLHVFSPTLAGINVADFAVSSNDCAEVLPAASCTLSVVFSPIGDGLRTATLLVQDDAAGAPQSVLLSGTGMAGLLAVSAVDPVTGFPSNYEDSAGVRLQLCIDPADPCVAGTTLPDPTSPPAVPGNFPDESFYYSAVSRLPVNGANRATLVLGLEAAFGNADGVVAAGDQITFQRINLRVNGGLVPGATYTVTHPYGVETVVADIAGAVTAKTLGSRVQVGCAAVPPACDFSIALRGRLGPFLRRDPGDLTLPLPPVGFLGDGVTTQRVTGSPLSTNLFRLSGPNVGGPGIDTIETDQFALTGKLAAEAVAAASL